MKSLGHHFRCIAAFILLCLALFSHVGVTAVKVVDVELRDTAGPMESDTLEVEFNPQIDASLSNGLFGASQRRASKVCPVTSLTN